MSVDIKTRRIHEALDFTRAVFSSSDVETTVWFRVLCELEQAFFSLGIDETVLRHMMRDETVEEDGE